MDHFDIHPSWYEVLKNEFTEEYFVKLQEYLHNENKHSIVFPKEEEVFAAFNKTPFDKLKVVLIGQDPYHGEGQANGLSFSVKDGIKKPPSLQNIFKELNSDLGIQIPLSGNLETWANEGVLLLNSSLTVRAKEAGSHQKIGWEIFTDKVIQLISDKKESVVFLLWGNFAHGKEKFIDSKKHLVLKAAHPSPLARGAFFGSKPFSKTNDFFQKNNIPEINWEV